MVWQSLIYTMIRAVRSALPMLAQASQAAPCQGFRCMSVEGMKGFKENQKVL